LRQQFPAIFDHLESILQKKGITDEDNVRLGNNPFTTMSIMRDYNCNIHIDADDISYGFFVWFGAHGKFFLSLIFLFAYIVVVVIV